MCGLADVPPCGSSGWGSTRNLPDEGSIKFENRARVRALVSLVRRPGPASGFCSVMSPVPRNRRGSPRASGFPSRQRQPKQRRHQAASTAERPPAQQVRVRTPGDIVNELTIEAIALRIWTEMVGAKFIDDMSNLMDELLQSHLLDDDDEEDDEGWLDDHHKRAKKLLDEAIADGLEKYPNHRSRRHGSAYR